ncbi:MAG: hypothetical protein LBD06_03235 [Candidatus Accumulibacter sp.]|nr:hypothetical protein [Accumulibacter sp.]
MRGQKTDKFAALSRRRGWKSRALGFSEVGASKATGTSRRRRRGRW